MKAQASGQSVDKQACPLNKTFARQDSMSKEQDSADCEYSQRLQSPQCTEKTFMIITLLFRKQFHFPLIKSSHNVPIYVLLSCP